MNAGAARFGSFDAERSWEDPRSARLPQWTSPLPDDAVAAMDELLAGMCNDGDVLFTRAPLLSAHREHLQSAGLPRLTAMAATPEEFAQTLCRLQTTHVLWPWAVTPEVEQWWSQGAVVQPLPTAAATQQVNSKVWSTQIRNELELAGFATIVRSAAELERTGQRILADSSHGMIVKEPFGVSGRGSMHVTNAARLRRLVAVMKEQESQDREVVLVVEEFVQKTLDFSTHLTIAADGSITLDGIHGMINRDLRYSMSCPLTGEWEGRLRTDSRHLETVMVTAKKAFAEGYFGMMCIDGMVLATGDVLSVVEVNARGSMGAINARLDAQVSTRDVRSALTAIPVLSNSPIEFADVLDRMVTARLPPDSTRRTGVIALSARTLPFNGGGAHDDAPRTGRMFISVLHESPTEIPGWIERMQNVLAAAGYVVT